MIMILFVKGFEKFFLGSFRDNKKKRSLLAEAEAFGQAGRTLNRVA
ncbi:MULTISPECIES: hypothetical protein [unclassified Moorena]|nr:MULTISPECIES: hypothetical protein [unclassified Moorena]NEO08798.1 hypothetical protein [Moorena sp. SIO3I8]NEP26781.1 hypothetical protein [Moorena sp. SIO3I6]